ncbi:MAG: 50S ribosomal protein L3 [Epsilonproteobacteria bacterium]|nr:50S ribosomal protein L3 [Campylobacterota bacterium]|tara:strand:+ start:272 stop:895 length:624 start_codon:yes stop_codon:yes gene_type:complete
MIQGFWGRKVGMTQIFSEDNKVVPVTAVDVSGWFVSQIKTEEKDGYNAVQVAYVRNKYQDASFEMDWLKNKAKYFRWVREIPFTQIVDDVEVGQAFNFSSIVTEKETVDVVGTTKGCGFAGVMRKHNYAGGPKGHGSMFKRKPGSIGFMCATGKVIKGKGMPGHMGVKRRTTKSLKVVQIKPDDSLILIKGSMAGKSGSLVFVRKCG